MSVPSTITLPLLGRSSPLTSRIRVDFPAPDRPMMPVMPARGTARSMPSSAVTASPSRVAKHLPTASRRMIGSAGAGQAAGASARRSATTMLTSSARCCC